MLLLPGPEHKGSKADEGWVLANGKRIFVAEQQVDGLRDDKLRQTTFTRIWDGADVLLRYLENEYRPLAEPQHIVELGAGCGLVGIAAGVLYPAARVTLTDLPAAISALRANIEQNQGVLGPNSGLVRAAPLDWTAYPYSDKSIGPCDLILASDVIWLVDLIDPFLDSLQRILRDNHACVALMTYQSRSKIIDHRLFSGLERRDLSCELTKTSKKVAVYRITLCSPPLDST